MAEKKKKPLWLKLIIIVLVIAIVGVAAFAGLSIMVYEQFFGIRYETSEQYKYYISDFDGLMCADYEFTSDKGQKLAGYLYHNGEGSPLGIIVFAHGFGGGGHNSYMDVISYFAKNGYYVFAYDATGNDNSEGKAVGGMPQGVIDLEAAIDFVKLQKEFYHLPIMLLGHSWGGYSVTNVLKYHPDVKAVASFCGFDKSSDLLYAQGKMMAGEAIDYVMPFMNAYEKLKFGEYAENTALGAFENTDAKIMAFHSTDDTTVPIEYGFDIWHEKYKDDPRFTFVKFEDKGHSGIFYSEEGSEYIKGFREAGKEWAEDLSYDYEAEENAERYKEDLTKYIKENLDREKWASLYDTELLGSVLEFYNSARG